jgi:uncharacterized C2H2 Zn-finger protein
MSAPAVSCPQQQTTTATGCAIKTSGCVVCGRDDRLLRCSRCKSVFYCTKEHQKLDWKRHKRLCPRLSDCMSLEEDIQDGEHALPGSNRGRSNISLKGTPTHLPALRSHLSSTKAPQPLLRHLLFLFLLPLALGLLPSAAHPFYPSTSTSLPYSSTLLAA